MEDSTGTAGRHAKPQVVDVVLARDGGWWEVRLPALGLSTSTRDPAMVETYARHLAAAALGFQAAKVVVALRTEPDSTPA